MPVNKELLTQPFDKSVIQKREGAGGKQLDYIEWHVVNRRLLEATGNEFDFEITELRQVGELWICTGRLTIPGLGSRMGIGVQTVKNAAKQEDLVKGAASDCLKVCATKFGVALELYGPDREANIPKALDVSGVSLYTAKQLLDKALANKGSRQAWDNLFTKLGTDSHAWADLLAHVTDIGLLGKLRDKGLAATEGDPLITIAADEQLAKITKAA